MIKFFSDIRNSMLKFEKLKKILLYAIYFSLFAYVFSIPSFANRSGYNIIVYATMALLIALTIAYVFLYGLQRKFDKRSLICILFFVSSFVGTIAYSHQFRGLLTIFLLIVSFYAIYFAMMIINNNSLIMTILVASFFVFAGYYIIYYGKDILNFKSYEYDEFRLGESFENPNTVGSFMMIALSVSSYLVLFKKGKLRYLFLIPTLLFVFIGITTGSRTFLVSIFVIFICFVIFKFKKRIWIALLIIAGFIGFSVLALNFIPFLETIRYRLEDTFKMFTEGLASGSTLERILWQKYGFYLASRRIFFGFGESGFAFASGVKTYTHGNFSEILCDFGIIGFFLFYCFNMLPMFVLFFAKKEDRKYVITICLVMLLNGFLSVYYYDKSTYLIMGLIYYLLDNAKARVPISKNSFKEVTI